MKRRRTPYAIRSTKIGSRPTWDEYFLGIAELVSKRSTCLRRHVGAVLVKDKRILATGYNGAPSKIAHCAVVGCIREKLKVPSGERHELCLPAGEEVLTSAGFVPIEKIRAGQRVMTHKGVYRPVTRTFKRRYTGELVYVEPRNMLPVALTPAHPVLAIRTQKCEFDQRTLCKDICKSVNRSYCNMPYLKYRPEWIAAGELRKYDLVVSVFDGQENAIEWMDFSFIADTPSEYNIVLLQRRQHCTYNDIHYTTGVLPSVAYNWVNGGVPRNCIAVQKNLLSHGSSPAKTIPARIRLSKRMLRLIGLYLAEGCSSSNQLSFSFHRKETDLHDEVRSTMKKVFGLECYEDIRRNSHKLVYSSVILAKTFKRLFGHDAYTKRLPPYLMKLAPEKQKFIIDAYAQGDGYRIDRRTVTTSTASRDLALQEMQILFRLGYYPVIDRSRNIYRLIWKDGIRIPYGYIKGNNVYSPVYRLSRAPFDEYVYNLEVETDNSYVTKSFIVHNCRGLHGEQNAFLQAALHGTSLKDSTLYCTNQPCIICAKMIINAGITEIVIKGDYPDRMSKKLLSEARVRVRTVK